MSAVLSPDGRYRYRLTRDLTEDLLPGPPVTFVMLNPSTADATVDDPTIRRCLGYARAWGAPTLTVVNLYAFRATQPRDLWQQDDPVGPDNDQHLANALLDAWIPSGIVVAAWGTHARPDRVARFVELARARRVQLHALKVTQAGAPGHPLYLRADAQLVEWPPA